MIGLKREMSVDGKGDPRSPQRHQHPTRRPPLQQHKQRPHHAPQRLRPQQQPLQPTHPPPHHDHQLQQWLESQTSPSQLQMQTPQPPHPLQLQTPHPPHPLPPPKPPQHLQHLPPHGATHQPPSNWPSDAPRRPHTPLMMDVNRPRQTPSNHVKQRRPHAVREVQQDKRRNSNSDPIVY